MLGKKVFFPFLYFFQKSMIIMKIKYRPFKIQNKFNELKTKFPHHSHSYTDSFKDLKLVAVTVVLDKQI